MVIKSKHVLYIEQTRRYTSLTKHNEGATYFFRQQIERPAGFVILTARHGYFAVQSYVFVDDGYVTVYDGADLHVFRNAKRVRSA